jgi:capsid protein
MQGPAGGGLPQGIDGYEQMVNTFAEQAKTFWRAWGPAGEPMVQGTEAWAQMQRAYVQWLGQTFEAGGQKAQRTRPASGMPLPGLTFNPWPGPGGSEGGGWDR